MRRPVSVPDLALALFLPRCGECEDVYPEMEFLDAIFSRAFYLWAINSSLLILEFLSGFLPSFSVLQNATYSLIDSSFLVRIFKTREEYGFL